MPDQSQPLRRPGLAERRPFQVAILAIFAVALMPAAGLAQPARTFTVGLFGTLGGFSDAQPDTDLTNLGFQALFSAETEARTFFGVRLGKLQLDTDGGPLYDSDIAYLTLAGEYSFTEGYYDSGLYVGLGFYDFAGGSALGDDSGVGLSVGATGDFRMTERFSLLVDLSAHYADLDHAQFLFLGAVGVGFHF